MFGLSRKTDYAVMALARLAACRREDPSAVLSARELAKADGLPAALLGGLLKELQRAGILTSRRGVRGGYALAADPEQIRLGDVIRAVEGPQLVQLVVCCGKDGEVSQVDGCRIITRCPISRAMRRLNRQLGRFLEQMTLAELLAQPAHAA